MFDQKITSNSYELRKQLFILINQQKSTQIQSYHAFTLTHTFDLNNNIFTDTINNNPEKSLDEYLSDEKVWIPTRHEFHQQIITKELNNIKALSDQLSALHIIKGYPPTPIIYLFRGNSCSGKSSNMKNLLHFKKQPDLNNNAHKNGSTKSREMINLKIKGFINPDSYKNILKDDLIENGKYPINNHLVHFEGAHLAYRLFNHPETINLSIVYDRRNTRYSNYEEIKNFELSRPKENRRKLQIFSTDSPLELCLVRMLHRDPHGLSPCVPYNALEKGHQQIRQSNLHILQDSKNYDWINFHISINHNQTNNTHKYSSDELSFTTEADPDNPARNFIRYINLNSLNNNQTPSRKQEDDLIRSLPPLVKAFDHRTDEEVNYCRQIFIDSEYFRKFNDKYGDCQNTSEILKKHFGKEIKKSINQKAEIADVSLPPQYQIYRNLFVKQFNLSSLNQPHIDLESKFLFIDQIFDQIWKTRANEIKNFSSIMDIFQTVNRSMNQPKIQWKENHKQFFKQLYLLLEQPNIPPRRIASYIEYHIGYKNLLSVQHPISYGQFLASWALIKYNHHKLPTKKITINSLPIAYEDFEMAYLENTFD